MSTEQDSIQTLDFSHVVNANTTARSILNEQRERRTEPEDQRSRRFGYNPAFRMMMDPVISGLQRCLIDPGVPILFETGPVSRQNTSVDAEDRTPPSEMRELLAGEGLGAIYQQNSHLGFRELLPLRGLSDAGAGERFYYVHPPLAEAVRQGVIEPCFYDLDVCITCRWKFLTEMTKRGLVSEQDQPLFDVLKESVTVGRSFMASQWRQYTGEVAGTKAGTNRQLALGALTDDHLFFMQQLHERTPDEMELAKIAANAKAQADVMERAMTNQASILASAMNQHQNAPMDAGLEQRLAQMQAEQDAMRVELAQLRGEAPPPPLEAIALATAERPEQPAAEANEEGPNS